MNFLVTWLHFEAVAKLFPGAERLADSVYSQLRRHNHVFGVVAVVIPMDLETGKVIGETKKTIGFGLEGLMNVARGDALRAKLDLHAGSGAGDFLDHVMTHVTHQIEKLPMRVRTGAAPDCHKCGHEMWLMWPQYFCPMCGLLQEAVSESGSDAARGPFCLNCGTKMRPSGGTYVCGGCGSTPPSPIPGFHRD